MLQRGLLMACDGFWATYKGPAMFGGAGSKHCLIFSLNLYRHLAHHHGLAASYHVLRVGRRAITSMSGQYHVCRADCRV